MSTMRNTVQDFFCKQTIQKKSYDSFKVLSWIVCIINNEVLAMYQTHPRSIVKPPQLQFLDEGPGRFQIEQTRSCTFAN